MKLKGGRGEGGGCGPDSQEHLDGTTGDQAASLSILKLKFSFLCAFHDVIHN